MSDTRSAVDRIYDLFRDVRNTNELWDRGCTGHMPTNPDALRYLQNHNVLATERERLGEIIGDIIAESFAPGPKTAEMVAYCKIEYEDNGHVWDEKAGKIVKDFIDEIEGQGVPR